MINNILIEVLSSMAEQERITIKKRQMQGMDAAKRKGNTFNAALNHFMIEMQHLQTIQGKTATL